MTSIYLRPAVVADIPAVADIAAAAWWAAYPSIISAEQIRYSLEHMYHADTLKKNIEENIQPIILACQQEQPIGFVAYQWKDRSMGIHKLAKLYLSPERKGGGLGRILVEAVENAAKAEGAKRLDLNVNRRNPALTFYQRLGFTILHEEKVPIGPYVMDDYVMGKEL